MAEKETLIGIGGTNCAGKDTAAEFLTNNFNLFHVSLSGLLRLEAERLGMAEDRDSLIEASKTLPRLASGIGALAMRGLEIYETVRDDNEYAGLLISSIRCPVDAKAIDQRDGSIIFIDAPLPTRYLRSQQRQRPDEANVDFQEFADQDDKEFFGAGDPYLPWQSIIKDMSRYQISNDSSIEQFKSKLLEVGNKITLST